MFLFLFDLTELHGCYFDFALVRHLFDPFNRVDFEVLEVQIKVFSCKKVPLVRYQGKWIGR